MPTNTLATITDALHACQVAITQQQSAQPLDMPDGPGWWAFVGKHVVVNSYDVEFVRQLVEWSIEDVPHPYTFDSLTYRFADERHNHQTRTTWFREEYQGKWYRLTMPWDAPQAASVAQTNALAHVQDALRLADQLQTQPTWEPITDESMTRTIEIIIDGLDEYTGCRLCRLVQPQQEYTWQPCEFCSGRGSDCGKCKGWGGKWVMPPQEGDSHE